MFKIFKLILICTTIFLFLLKFGYASEEKIKIGLLVPMSGEKIKLGQSIIKSTRLALKDVSANNIEIYPRDTVLNPNKTLRSAIELKELGVKIIIGPVFFDNTKYLSEVENIIFLSLTNKTKGLPSNVISSGVNSVSQLNAIKKFAELNKLRTILLTPDLNTKPKLREQLKNLN